jgi:hypothetical protein
MKRLTLIVAVSLFCINAYAEQLILVPTKSLSETLSLIESKSIRVHYYNDDFAIATAASDPKGTFTILDQNPWKSGMSYYIVLIDKHVSKTDYINSIQKSAYILYDGGSYLIIKTNETLYGQLQPAKNDGMVRIFNRSVIAPKFRSLVNNLKAEPNPVIQGYLSEVSASNITATVQHLQNYGTRDSYQPQSIQAQNWLYSQFEQLGLSVQTQDFTMPGGSASDNVIATKLGTKYPNEYVVVGGHYDSRSSASTAPGADDNASGTAAVLEIARILSQYEFDRSIIFCAFSGEEYGLYGSSAYASSCAQQGKDIFGYFNLDMIGYLQLGNSIMTTLIYPQSALELANFYTSVCSVYLPNFIIQPGSFTGGDSDHTSFNNNGFMGIFPFENINAYSPYIHTANDVVGTSYNNENQAAIFTKASLASIVTMANMLMPPSNLVAIPGDGFVTLQWSEMFDIDNFKIYRNGEYLSSTTSNTFTDFGVENGTQYAYYITAIYSESGNESAPSNTAMATPMPPIDLPLFLNFENGSPYWNLQPSWGITSSAYYSASHSLTDSPNGNYQNTQETFATLDPLNLQGYTAASLSFWTKYDLENSWDYVWIEVSTNNQSWTSLDQFTGTQSSWVKKTYSLNSYIDQPYVRIRFRFKSDNSVVKDGIYIDDFEVTVEGGFNKHHIAIPSGWSGISSYVVPVNTNIQQVLSPIASKLIILENLEQAYWPAEEINTIVDWSSGSGYFIKCSQNATLTLSGNINGNRTIELLEGWNLIPVISSCEVNCNEVFGPISSQIDLIKEVASSRVYWPSQGIESLSQLWPGKAYLVKANSAVAITYPECSVKEIEVLPTKAKAQSAWAAVSPTPHSHTIGFTANAIQLLQVGDIIGVFTPNGICAGEFAVESNTEPFALVAFSNDLLTTAVDGMEPNDAMSFKLLRGTSKEEFNLIPTYDNSMPNEGFFIPEGISLIQSFALESTGITPNPFNFKIFPNPARESVTIQIDIENALVEAINISGQVVYKTTITHEITINTASWPSGVYMFKIIGGSSTHIRRIVVTSK